MKNSSLKISLIAFVVLMLSLALCACSSDPVEPPPSSCEHNWNMIGTTDATCTTDGANHYECSLCKETKEERLEATGHTVVVEKGYASTCTVDGVSDSEWCDVCKVQLKKAEYIPAPGHNIVEDKGYAATCTVNGLSDGSHCDTCDEVVVAQKVIGAPGHNPVFDKGYAATCTVDGLTDGYHCGVCQTVTVTQTVITAPGHSEEIDYGYDPSCAEDGLSNGSHCWVCDEVLVEQTVISAPGHTYVLSEAKEATCESTGHTSERYCEECKILFEVEREIPKAIHSYVDGECKWCHLVASKGLEFTPADDGDGYILSGIGECSDTEIVVPNVYELKPVVAVAKDAFEGNSTVVKITLPDTLTKIGEGAFEGCGALLEIYLPESVTEVEANAFSGCSSLQKVECEDYTQVKDWSENCFGSGANKLTSDKKDGKTPYEVYLEAMAAVGQNATSYKSTYTNHVILQTLDGTVIQEAAPTVYTEMVGMDMYTSYSPSVQLNSVFSMSEFWYKSGIYYINRQSSSSYYYSGYIKQTVSPDYIRALASDLQSNVPAPGEETFKSAEFVRNSDGSYTLTLTLDEDQIGLIVVDMLAMIFGAEADKYTDMVNFTECIFKYDFDKNGNIAHIYVDAKLAIEDMYKDNYGRWYDGVAIIDGDVAYSEVGTLKSLTKATPTNYYDADKDNNCSHGQSYHVTVPGYAATCTGDGLTDGVYCSNCMAAVTPSTTIYSNGHTTNQGVCDDCGEFIGSVTEFDVKYNEDGKTAILVGLGSVSGERIEIPESICGIKIVEIGAGVFEGLTDLTEVSIPDSVIVIGDRAFAGCTSLTEVTLSQKVIKIGKEAFAGCENIEYVRIDGNSDLEVIGESAFLGCESLKYFHIGENVVEIGANAFKGCSAELYLCAFAEGASESWSTYWNADNVKVTWSYVPSTAGLEYSYRSTWDSTIREYVYYYVIVGYNGTETEIFIRGDYMGVPIKEIEGGAFEDSKITSVVIADGIETIGAEAFRNAKKLASISLPDTLKTIGEYAFFASALTEVTIGENVTSIAGYAFGGCDKLTVVYYNAKAATVPTKNNGWGVVGTSPFMSNSDNPAKFAVIIGSSVESIPAYLFSQSHVESVTFAADSVCTHIGEYAFSNADDLTEIELPDTLTSIGLAAFETYVYKFGTLENGIHYVGNTENPYLIFIDVKDNAITELKLNEKTKIVATSVYTKTIKYVEIGENVTYICDGAFSNCTAATELVYRARNAVVGNNAFVSSSGIRFGSDEGFTLTIGNKVEKLPAKIFQNLEELASVVFEEGSVLSEIESMAFYGAENLKKIVFPNSLTTIGANAFNMCSNLMSVTLGTGVTTIGDNAFMNCNKLYEVVNNSSLTIVVGTRDHGRVAYYAKVVTTGESGLVEIDGCVYLRMPGYEYDGTVVPDRYVLLKYIGEGGDIVLPEKVNGLTYYIEKEAFAYNTEITSIVIGSGATSIGEKAFIGNTKLKTVTIGSNVETINTEAFSGCTALTDLTILDGEKPLTIYTGVFFTCSALKNVSVPNRLATVFEKGFNSAAEIVCTAYGNLKYIGNSENPYVLVIGMTDVNATSVTIHEDTKAIMVRAIENATYLTELIFKATEMNDLPAVNNVFLNAGSNTAGISVTIAKNVKRVPAYLLMPTNISPVVSNITSIVFEGASACVYVGANAFGYTKITSISLPDTISAMGLAVFSSCTQLESANIPTGLTVVPPSMFNGCTKIASVTIHGKITEICDNAFSYTGLTTVVIPEGVTKIGRSAFANCANLTTVVIPSTVTEVAEFAFYSCYNLKNIYYGGTLAEWNNLPKGQYSNLFSNSFNYYYKDQWTLVDGVPTKN